MGFIIWTIYRSSKAENAAIQVKNIAYDCWIGIYNMRNSHWNDKKITRLYLLLKLVKSNCIKFISVLCSFRFGYKFLWATSFGVFVRWYFYRNKSNSAKNSRKKTSGKSKKKKKQMNLITFSVSWDREKWGKPTNNLPSLFW